MIELGNLVKTPYGEGIVVGFRRQQLVVEPTTWKMAGGQKPTFYMNPADVRPVFRVGDAVRTVYGPGEIVKIRESDGFYVVHMRDWKLASGQSPVLYLDERALRIDKVAGVSVQSEHSFKSGDYVQTPYGSGTVSETRADGIVIVRPDTWVLDRNKIPIFYMHHSAVKPKQRVEQKVAKLQSFDEKFAEIKQLKEEGNKFFKDKNYEQAKDRYAQCIDGLNSLGDTSTDEQRSHLFEQTVSCHNNMGICLLRLQRYSDCFNMARSALYLIDAFESLYPDSRLWQFLIARGFSIEILLKVWKKKTLFLMGKSSFFKQDYEDAVKYLEQALRLISHDKSFVAEIKELTDLLAQSSAKLQKQNKAEKDMWKKAFTKQQEEEVASEKLAESITSGSPKAATIAGNLSPLGKPDKKSKKNSGTTPSKPKKAESGNQTPSSVPWTAIGIAVAAVAAIGGLWWLKSRR